MLKNSIRADKSCYTTRAVDSNPASVMNLKEKVGTFNDIQTFLKEMINYFSLHMTDLEECNLSPEDREEATSLAETRYRSWEWNFAYGPEYIFKNAFLFDDALNCCILNIRNGVVLKCIIDGSDKMFSIAGKLKGCRHMVPDFLNLFERENITISQEEIFNFF
jgi:lipoate-protein ligase A